METTHPNDAQVKHIQQYLDEFSTQKHSLSGIRVKHDNHINIDFIEAFYRESPAMIRLLLAEIERLKAGSQ